MTIQKHNGKGLIMNNWLLRVIT